MWVQAGFPPSDFYGQTPIHFQMAMEGVRNRMERDVDASMALAYETAVFFALAQSGKLKQLSHYQRRSSAQTAVEMLEAFKAMGAGSNMKVRRVKLDAVND